MVSVYMYTIHKYKSTHTDNPSESVNKSRPSLFNCLKSYDLSMFYCRTCGWWTLHRKLLWCIHSNAALIAALIGNTNNKLKYWWHSHLVNLFIVHLKVPAWRASSPVVLLEGVHYVPLHNISKICDLANICGGVISWFPGNHKYLPPAKCVGPLALG